MAPPTRAPVGLQPTRSGRCPSTHFHPFRFPPAPPPEVTLRPLPSPATGLPRLPVSPSLRAVPTTPADRNGCIRRLLPRSTRPSPNLRRGGVHIFTFEACSGFTRVRPARSLNRPRRPLSQGFGPAGYPTRPPVSYQIKPTTVWVDPSSTGVTRRRGALRSPGFSPSRRRRHICRPLDPLGVHVPTFGPEQGSDPPIVPPIYSIHRRNLGILHHHRIPFPACIRSSKSSRTARRSTQKSLPCDSR